MESGLPPDADQEAEGELQREPDWPKDMKALRNWAIKTKNDAAFHTREYEEQVMLATMVDLETLSRTLFGLPDDKRPEAWEEYAELLRMVARVIDLILAPGRP
jgi:hypothetical protein